MNNYLKETWKIAEQLVADHYKRDGYTIIERNYTIRGGELDIIASKDNELIFIEVKAVHHTDDLHNYITPTKLSSLKRTIEYYLWTRGHDPLLGLLPPKSIRLDVAFVRWNIILDIYRNVTNN